MKRTSLPLKYFLRGLSLLVPFGLTAFACWYVVHWLNSRIITPLFSFLIGPIPGLSWIVNVPGLCLFLTGLTVVGVGMIASTLFVQALVQELEKLVMKMPLINILYSYVKESTFGFVDKLNKPVLVQLKEGGEQVGRVGFITQDKLYALSLGSEYLAVYLPHSYSFSGELTILHRSQVTELELTTNEAMRFLLTGGLASLERPLIDQEKVA